MSARHGTRAFPNDAFRLTGEEKLGDPVLGLGWILEVSHVGKPLAVQEFLRHILWREAGDRNLGYRRRGILQQMFHPGAPLGRVQLGFVYTEPCSSGTRGRPRSTEPSTECRSRRRGPCSAIRMLSTARICVTPRRSRDSCAWAARQPAAC